jgi:DeoR/GlpR family transcriptional regulator of sugar metabolism
MLSPERIKEITEELKTKNAVCIKDLAKKHYTSESTIRRDLERLEKLGIVKRIYGGAVLLEGINQEIPLLIRENDQKTAKDIIAHKAVSYIENGNIICLDSSSTVFQMVPLLKSFERLTVITNGAKTAVECGNLLNARVYGTGGLLRENSLSFIGESAKKSIMDYNTDILFFSCRALSMEKGLTDISEDEAQLRKLMIDNAKRVVLLMDSSKFDKVSFCNICSMEYIKDIVTEKKPSDKWLDFFNQNNIRVLF